MQAARGDLEFGSIPGLVARAAERYREALALEQGELRISFADLHRRVRRLARGLIARGLQPGARVALWAPNHWRWAVAALAVQAAGGVLVTINTRYRGREASDLLDRTDAQVLFTVQGFLGTDYVGLLEEVGARVPRTTVLLSGGPRSGCSSWEELCAAGADLPVGVVDDRVGGIRPEDPADILFTSGTTGRPRGAVCSHAQALRAYRDWAAVVGLRAGDRYLVVAPFFHCFGYKAGLLASLMAGATVLPHAVFDADAVLRRVAREGITVLPGPPALYQSFLAHPERQRHDLSSLRLAVTGAASIPVVLIERMRDVLDFDTVITGYGLTEACGIATMCREGDPPELIASTSGRAIPGVEVEIHDASGRSLPPGTEGEVVVRGYNLMLGYLDDPEGSAQAIDARGWLHTGDIGRLDAGGNLSITDRLKDMFIVGGFNAYPAEIEAELCRHPDIAEVAVIGVPHPRLGEVGAAFVVPLAGREIRPDALIEWCRPRMANFKRPRHVRLVSSLPRNASGKITKFRLREEWSE